MIRRQTLDPATPLTAGAIRGGRRLALWGGLVLLPFVLLAGAVLGYQLLHNGRVYRGVHAAGQDLSGLTAAEAQSRLGGLTSLPAGDLHLRTADGAHQWTLS